MPERAKTSGRAPRAEHGPVASAERLEVTLGGRLVLKGIDIALKPGEVVGLAGPNGAGKTTLVRALSGLVAPSSGRAKIGDADAVSIAARERARQVAVVFQDNPPIAGYSVRDVVGMGRYPWIAAWSGPGAADAAVVEKAMSDAGVGALADRSQQTLSGGEKQLVQLARALAQEPRVLLLDEPEANLDLGHQYALGERVRALAATGLAILFSAHDLTALRLWCDRVVVLSEGRVAASGVPKDALAADVIRRVYGVDERRP